jgi:DNA-binding FadR family transcriptional regulator
LREWSSPKASLGGEKARPVQFRESYEVRMALEGFASARAAIRAKNTEIIAIVETTDVRGDLNFDGSRNDSEPTASCTISSLPRPATNA